MQPAFHEIKNAAKTALKHRWAEAVAVTLLLLGTILLNSVCQWSLMNIFKVDEVWSPFSPTAMPTYNRLAGLGLTLFSAIFSLCVTFPLTFGVMRWFWLISGGSDTSFNELFHYFSSGKLLLKSIRLSLALFIRLILGAVICYLPYALVSVISNPKVYEMFNWGLRRYISGISALAPTLSFLGLIAFLLWLASYSLFFAVMNLEPDQTVKNTIRRTVHISKDQRFRSVGFLLSFTGWLLSCLLIVPLPFVLSYFMTSASIFGREAYRYSSRCDILFDNL